MSLLELLRKDFILPDAVHLELLDIDNHIRESFNYKNEYIINNTSAHYRDEIILQKQIAESAKKTMLGFESLEKELNDCLPEEPTCMRFIESSSWDGRVYFSKTGILLGAILGKKSNKNWKTPPNWDGSVEMLKEFNERFDSEK